MPHAPAMPPRGTAQRSGTAADLEPAAGASWRRPRPTPLSAVNTTAGSIAIGTAMACPTALTGVPTIRVAADAAGLHPGRGKRDGT